MMRSNYIGKRKYTYQEMKTSSVGDLELLCQELSAKIQELNNADENNDLSARRKATAVARKLYTELVHPDEVAAEQMVTMSEWASIRMFIEWKIFDLIPLDGNVSWRELAASVGVQEELVSRLGRMLVSTGGLRQPAPGRVAHSRLSLAYRSGDCNGALFFTAYDTLQPALVSLPGFFNKYEPRLPRGKTYTPVTFAAGVDGRLTHWEVLEQRGPTHLEQFGLSMQGMIDFAWPYTGVYDFAWVEEYAAGAAERPLIVDVGGSYGHALRANLVKYPGIPPARCVVEDRPEMIASIEKAHADDPVMRDVQKIACDFHAEQSVKGALIYFIRRCLHDYDDDDCVGMLKILAAALPEDEPRARILINDQIMTDPPDRWVATMDITMLAWSSLERTEEQFATVVRRAGLDVVKVHKVEGQTMGVVECKKV
ncbi:S-adenosyl-L-methionine-dependent methyltransferase [Durotheca rogersii]|uniref:S-adenosyl-L-methionine-dependent methyltransferase n=1 Tax=Durotheca rogersii TaxID=419775 RepID=UPI00221E65C6|nr:S-adenosyl-L-methionine-dependent methyltransferase [Durotheca rogersii]KAI5866993.1 S-adenosyl-L-methionine-dependent methyltransferase [Durotheca rogersii]